MTTKNMEQAFIGECIAHIKYIAFARQAEIENKPNIARLFRAISFAEQVHALNHLKTLEEIGTTEENVQNAIDGENFEVEEMYPGYDAVAKLQNEKDAVRSIHFAIESERIHSAMYIKAKHSLREGEDLNLGEIYICTTCGYTAESPSPEYCPVCGLRGKEFAVF